MLVTAGFPMTELWSALSLRNVSLPPIFQATDTLLGLEDDYVVTRDGDATGSNVLVLRIGQDREILRVSTLQQELESSLARE